MAAEHTPHRITSMPSARILLLARIADRYRVWFGSRSGPDRTAIMLRLDALADRHAGFALEQLLDEPTGDFVADMGDIFAHTNERGEMLDDFRPRFMRRVC
jgi:hypothetical protein